MSYQVIARKYRPQSFLELIGQEHVATSLLNSLRNQRMPQALLFTGTRGVGKTSSARIFAKSIRCPNAKDFVPCNECRDCLDVTNGSSVDVMEIDGASNNGVDAIRELRDSVSYMPANGKYKVYIIDEVHMLSNSAFNALLKTLEEPPSHVIFIFATTEPQKIPMTILSRCQRYDFRKVSTNEITSLLEKIAAKEEITCDKESLWLIAKNAGGSVRDALSSLDLCISFSGKELKQENISELLGLSDRNLRMNILKALATRDKSTLVNTIEEISQSSADPKVFMHNFLEDLRNLLVVKINPKSPSTLLDISEMEWQDLNQIAEQLSEEEIHLLFDMGLKGAGDLQRAFEPKIVLEMVFLRMVAAPKITYFYADAEKTADSVEKKSPPTANKEAVNDKKPEETFIETKKKPEVEKTKAFTNMSQLQKRWPEAVKFIESKNPMLGSKLKHAAIILVEDSQVKLEISEQQEFLISDLNSDETNNKINELLNDWGLEKKVRWLFSKAANKEVASPIAKEIKVKKESEEKIKKKIESSEMFIEVNKVFKMKNPKIKELT